MISNEQRTRIFGKSCDIKKYQRIRTPWGINVIAHPKVADRFIIACLSAHDGSRWNPRRIDSYSCRTIRGSKAPSLHSWALAWDFFSTEPGVIPPGGVWKPDRTFGEDFANHFEEVGFRWGRWFNRQDWPHIEWADGEPGPLRQEAIMAGVPNATSACIDPVTGGVWVQGRDGAVYAFRGAPYHDAYNTLPEEDRQGYREFIAIQPNDRGGYIQIANDGSLYDFPL